MELFELTRTLIDIPSISGDEGDLCGFLESYFNERGYKTERQDVANGRTNLLVNQSEPASIVMSTHLDTVPPFISSSEDEQFIYGRGSCDAKGIIAAQIFALESLKLSETRNVGLLFTVDEELGSLGARAANKHPLGAICKFLINGEPTENMLASGSKGSLRLRIRVYGRAAHSAYPEYGISAIDTLLEILSDLRNTEWPADDFFGATTCNIGVIRGGTRPNIIPAEAYADIQIRLVTDSSVVKIIVSEIIARRGEVEYLSCTEPVRLYVVDGFSQRIARFTTDIPYLSNWGRPLLVGPGSILDAHTTGEKISKKELSDSVGVYMKLVRLLLSVKQ